MNALPPLFALALVPVAVLASIGLWAPRRLWIKFAALIAASMFAPTAYTSLAALLGRPKPVELEWSRTVVEEATVLGSSLHEGEAIYLWLQLEKAREPMAYALPWDVRLAEQLQEAQRAAADEDGGGEVRVRLPFERSWDDREPKFYAPPQPRPPAKRPPPPPIEVPGTAT